MKRDVVITVLLVIAGIILAICLFAAGLLWREKPTTKGTPVSCWFSKTEMFVGDQQPPGTPVRHSSKNGTFQLGFD